MKTNKRYKKKKGGGDKIKAFSKIALLTAAPGGFFLAPTALRKAYKEKQRTGKSMSKWINDDSTKWAKDTFKKYKNKMKTMKKKLISKPKSIKKKSNAKSKKKKHKKKKKQSI